MLLPTAARSLATIRLHSLRSLLHGLCLRSSPSLNRSTDKHEVDFAPAPPVAPIPTCLPTLIHARLVHRRFQNKNKALRPFTSSSSAPCAATAPTAACLSHTVQSARPFTRPPSRPLTHLAGRTATSFDACPPNLCHHHRSNPVNRASPLSSTVVSPSLCATSEDQDEATHTPPSSL